MKSKLLLAAFIILFCARANAQIYDDTFWPDDCLSSAIHETYLKDVYKSYRKTLTDNKVKKAVLTVERGGGFTIEYNGNGFTTDFLNSNPNFPQLKFVYDQNNNISSIINPYVSEKGFDTTTTSYFYENEKLVKVEMHHKEEPAYPILQYYYNTAGSLSEIKNFAPEQSVFITFVKADYDSDGMLSGFFNQSGEKYYTITHDANSFSYSENNHQSYKYILSDNKIKQLIMGTRTLDYFYNENGLIDYTILSNGKAEPVKTVYSYEHY